MYEPSTQRYTLPQEHAIALGLLAGACQAFISMIKAEPRISEVFRTGGGVYRGEHDSGMFTGVERFFRPGYEQHLVSEWIPALDGIQRRLEQGGHIADVGCGHGASRIIPGKGFPISTVIGFDNHAASIARAREAAAQANASSIVTLQVASATQFSAQHWVTTWWLSSTVPTTWATSSAGCGCSRDARAGLLGDTGRADGWPAWHARDRSRAAPCSAGTWSESVSPGGRDALQPDLRSPSIM